MCGMKGDKFMEHKTRNKALSWLLSLALMLSFLPGMSLTAKAAGEYTLWVGGTQVTDSNLSGTGWSYNASTSTLTLSEATISGGTADSQVAAIYANGVDLTINVTADSTVSGPEAEWNSGICVKNGNLSVTGSGKLTVNAGKTTKNGCHGVQVPEGSFTVEGTVNATGGEVSGYGASYGVVARSVIIEAGGTLTATGGKASYSSGVSYGISVLGDTTMNGTLTASGGESPESNGILTFGVLSINGSLTATGSTKAINCVINGKVKNAILGTGWNSVNGDGNGTAIAVSTEGQTLDYQKVHFEKPAHNHSFTYAVGTGNEANTITATCSNHDNCPLESNGYIAKLTIVAPATGGGAATLSGDTSAFDVSASDIKYYTKSGSGWTGEMTTPPTADGFYKASITAGSQTVSVIYGVHVITKAADFNATEAHGDFGELPAVAAVNANVTISTTPETGYELASLTVTKASGGTVSATVTGDNGSFTMPEDGVTVSATFAPRSFPVLLNVAGDTGKTCKAALLTDAFAPTGDGFKKKAGEQFVLSVSTDDEYDYSVMFDPSNTVSTYLKEFSTEEYRRYAAYVKENSISVPMATDLFWVTMPGLGAESLTINITFSKVKTFTVLYQPNDANTNAVWCKFTKTTGGTEKPFAVEMMPDAIVGNQSVWMVKVTAAFDPAQAAFVTKKEDLETAGLTNITARQEVPTGDGDWTPVTGGKAVVIGGNAKTVMALFVTNAKALGDYESLTATYNQREGSGITFKVAVCKTDSSGVVIEAGTVTAPAAPAGDAVPEGKQFDGWRVLEGEDHNKEESQYQGNASISIKENTILNVVWKTATPTITLNLRGGTGIENTAFTVTYKGKLPTLATPTKDGFEFDGWAVGEEVTENGEFFAKGSSFDTDTPITANLKLTARWKHVHSYSCFQISEFGEALADYQSYAGTLHVEVCSCMDVALKAHSFDSNGKCACGYEKPQPTEFTLEVSYQKWVNGACEQTIKEMPTTKKRNQVVSVYAPDIYGDLYKFSKWEYSTDGGNTWRDLTADSLASFKIPCNAKLRAIYTNPTTAPQVDLSARHYLDHAEGYDWDNVVFHMDYKLPDGYSIVDAGVRLGDNAGISYYELKELKRTAGEKAAAAGINFGVGMLSLDLGGALVGAVEGATSLESNFYYEKRENSVLDEMTAEKLSDYMFQRKPVNVEKYPPIYWQSQSVTEGQSASVDVVAPLSFIQKNNGNHWIYGIAWLRYKTSDGTTKVIHTPALATTRDNIPGNTVTKSGS